MRAIMQANATERFHLNNNLHSKVRFQEKITDVDEFIIVAHV